MGLKEVAEVANHLATAAGILMGGTWVLYQYVIRRSGETGLSIDIGRAVSGLSESQRLLFLDVTFKNPAMRALMLQSLQVTRWPDNSKGQFALLEAYSSARFLAAHSF